MDMRLRRPPGGAPDENVENRSCLEIRLKGVVFMCFSFCVQIKLFFQSFRGAGAVKHFVVRACVPFLGLRGLPKSQLRPEHPPEPPSSLRPPVLPRPPDASAEGSCAPRTSSL